MSDVAELVESLTEKAPTRLLPQVLLETGSADGYVSVAGPVGPMLVAFNDRGVSAVDLGGDPARFERWFGDFSGRRSYPVVAMPTRLRRELDRALASGRLGDLPIDWTTMSPFQQEVLRKTAEIRPGEVRPYSWVAREIGRPRAARAVGTALARNPVPVVVPCHRVVRNDGTLGNYAYGTAVKHSILEQEGMDVAAAEDLARRRVRLVASDTTRIFCLPTCRAARRIGDAHLVEFRDQRVAIDAGYRPCRQCRPAA